MTPGGYGMATYPWDLSNIANATPANQKTSLLEVRRELNPFGCARSRDISCTLANRTAASLQLNLIVMLFQHTLGAHLFIISI